MDSKIEVANNLRDLAAELARRIDEDYAQGHMSIHSVERMSGILEGMASLELKLRTPNTTPGSNL